VRNSTKIKDLGANTWVAANIEGGPMFDSDNVALLVPLAFITIAFLAVVVKEVRKYASHRHELDAKRDMVERGLSVEEIERVIAAKTSADA
jgi:hypothetical protein